MNVTIDPRVPVLRSLPVAARRYPRGYSHLRLTFNTTFTRPGRLAVALGEGSAKKFSMRTANATDLFVYDAIFCYDQSPSRRQYAIKIVFVPDDLSNLSTASFSFSVSTGSDTPQNLSSVGGSFVVNTTNVQFFVDGLTSPLQTIAMVTGGQFWFDSEPQDDIRSDCSSSAQMSGSSLFSPCALHSVCENTASINQLSSSLYLSAFANPGGEYKVEIRDPVYLELGQTYTFTAENISTLVGPSNGSLYPIFLDVEFLTEGVVEGRFSPYSPCEGGFCEQTRVSWPILNGSSTWIPLTCPESSV